MEFKYAKIYKLGHLPSYGNKNTTIISVTNKMCNLEIPFKNSKTDTSQQTLI